MLGLRLIDDAGREFHRLWSIRASVGFAVFTAVAGGIGWFSGTVNPYVLLVLAVLFNLALIPLSRLAKQEEKAATPPPALPATEATA
jgi:hypothetical protein